MSPWLLAKLPLGLALGAIVILVCTSVRARKGSVGRKVAVISLISALIWAALVFGGRSTISGKATSATIRVEIGSVKRLPGDQLYINLVKVEKTESGLVATEVVWSPYFEEGKISGPIPLKASYNAVDRWELDLEEERDGVGTYQVTRLP